ncbi:hypothetical protein [Carboxylicivirga marina]|uniref:STAS domain-containing protein n=1 Tax=Carboxylicivirga marina TaxID=2800988 RepID=A0ABS1HGR9_9BACT|nr:hypothetical protein [Carboxylicivirga marina]MBK3516675.1 hypothetical protein [Carboxylicivirga marina]
MKKLYTRQKFKLRQQRHFRRTKKQRWRRKLSGYNHSNIPYLISNGEKKYNAIQYHQDAHQVKPKVVAPTDFRLLSNTEECVSFFHDLRSEHCRYLQRGRPTVTIDLSFVEQMDYSTISIMTSINEDFKAKGILLRGNYPINEECKQFFIDSGFLNNMYDERGRKFPTSEMSESLFFQKGAKRLERKDNIRLSNVVKNIVKHLTNESNHWPKLREMLLEICGNSLEWSKAENKQWLFGVMYEKDRVIVTVTDVGLGILKTLHRNHTNKFLEEIRLKKRHKVLMGAFEGKYTSKSKKSNRNLGLPSIKANFESKRIKELKVLTNNVILHFDNTSESGTINGGGCWFKGTFYRWIITKECLNT